MAQAPFNENGQVDVNGIHYLRRASNVKLVHEIFSAVQSDMADLGGERLQSAEYVDAFRAVAFEIHSQSDVVTTRISKVIPTTPPVPIPPLAYTYTVAHPGGLLVRSMYRVLRGGALDTATGAILGGMEMREYSAEAVEQGASFNRPHIGNDYNTDTGNLLRMFSSSMNGDSIQLKFALGLGWNERLDIDVLMYESVGAFARFAAGFGTITPTSVPQWMADAIESGMRHRLIEKLFVAGSDKAGQRLQPSHERWRYHLIKLKEYLHNFKDRRSPLQIQPMKWLSE